MKVHLWSRRTSHQTFGSWHRLELRRDAARENIIPPFRQCPPLHLVIQTTTLPTFCSVYFLSANTYVCVCKCMQMYLRGLNQQCHPNSTPHQKNHQIHPGDSVTRSKGVTKTASQPWSSTCGGQRQPCRTDLRPKGGGEQKLRFI